MSDELHRAQGLLDELKRRGVAALSLAADSRLVRTGDVFLAYAGARVDGRRFVDDAVAHGAAAVVCERQEQSAQPAPGIPRLDVEDLRPLSGWLAHLVYGRPSEKLWTVGVTGTNGKTSVSQWIAQAFEQLGRRSAVIGTLGCGFPGALEENANTTPDALSVHRLMAAYLAQGAQATVMEVSSIGLDQGRVNGVQFDVAVFTNLTRDHLDYHADMDAYAGAKRRLFEMRGLKAAILNLDDALGRQLARMLTDSGVVVSGYSLQGAAGATLRATNIVMASRGLRFTAHTSHGDIDIETRLIGRFNVANLLAVLGTLLASGVPLDAAAAVLPGLTSVPGRMQALGGEGEPLVVVDYAHTPDALEQALLTLRESARARGGRLLCVFGCGGNRDPGKRPLMGEVAARCADAVMLTSDNPRDESPETILSGIASGTAGAAHVRKLVDRAEAIHVLVVEADARDVVLVAGKGHETYQEVAGRRRAFSDVDCAEAALAAWRRLAA